MLLQGKGATPKRERAMISRLRKAASDRAIAIGALVGVVAAVNCFSAGIALAQRSQGGALPDTSSPQDRAWCENRQRAFTPDVSIKGCTAIIEAGNLTRSDLAVSFN